jgi:sulfate adenylyltransferase
MIKPHGSEQLNPLFVYDVAEHQALTHKAASLPSMLLSSAAAANAVMMGSGYFNPLTGYMNLADALSTAEHMKTTSGLFWPVPVLNLTKDISAIKGHKQMRLMTEKVYRTTDPEHPGVAAFNSAGRYAVSGPIKVLSFSYFQTEFPDTFRTAVEIRNEIAERGWKKVVAFQTRNPMHRAHEELCHMAMDRLGTDGLVIHMVELYFKPNSAMVTGYGFDMLYAGPREAVLHAVFRQNMGATHFIIGRDHAGVGDYYGPFDAQAIFDDVPKGALKIEMFMADNTAWSKKLGRVVMMREAPGHTKEDFITLSGTKVREMLGRGEAPPPEFSRPEVAKILSDYYQSQDKA